MFAGTALPVHLFVYAGLSLFIIYGPYLYVVVCVLYAYNLTQQQHIAVLKQVGSQPQNQPRPVSVPPVANMPLPLYPQRCPSDKGSKKHVQAENANAPRKSSGSETDRLQHIQEELRRCIGPFHVKELAKFFTPTSDEEENSRVNNRTRHKKLFEPKKEEESEK